MAGVTVRNLIFSMSAVCAILSEAQTADTISWQMLDDFTIETAASKKLMRGDSTGRLLIDARHLAEQISLMGSRDPLAVVRSLPDVATTNDLQASLPVRGASTGSNLFAADGARVVNPLHMLGLFSAFNPAFYKEYSFRAGRIPSHSSPTTSAIMTAESGMLPDSIVSGNTSVGLIESHVGVRVPLIRNRLSVAAAIRQSYLSLLFPNILKLGDSRLGYSFTDVNVSATYQEGDNGWRLSVFANRDRMKLSNSKNGTKEGDLGWGNSAVSLTWHHRGIQTVAAYSTFSNYFNITEGGRLLDLPSYTRQLTLSCSGVLFGFELGGFITGRHVSGQNGFGEAKSFEGKAAAQRRFAITRRLDITAGAAIEAYTSRGWTCVTPLPRVSFDLDCGKGVSAWIEASRLVRTDRLIEETTAGLPADFWICAGRDAKPEDVWSGEIGVSFPIRPAGAIINVSGYGKLMRNLSEFTGALTDLSSPDYNPLGDIGFGKGYAIGISISANRQIGRVRARVNYNLGQTRFKFYGDNDGYTPSAHDRPHDLNASLNWDVGSHITLSASYTLASGTPYTRAKFGYMIGENLICEYFPHNSSRLPTYKRLDLAASWRLTLRGLTHCISATVYNALANHNVLFIYTRYSLDKGIEQRRSVMSAFIPSLTYELSF